MDHCSHTPCAICDRRIAELEAEVAKANAAFAQHAEYLNGRLSAAHHQRDALDCSLREGAGVYHCPLDAKCQACRFRDLEAALRPLLAHIDEYRHLTSERGSEGEPGFEQWYVVYELPRSLLCAGHAALGEPGECVCRDCGHGASEHRWLATDPLSWCRRDCQCEGWK